MTACLFKWFLILLSCMDGHSPDGTCQITSCWHHHRLPKALWIVFKSLEKIWLWGWAPKSPILCSASFDWCSIKYQNTNLEGSAGEKFQRVALMSVHWTVHMKHLFLFKKNSVTPERFNIVNENSSFNVFQILILIKTWKTWTCSVQYQILAILPTPWSWSVVDCENGWCSPIHVTYPISTENTLFPWLSQIQLYLHGRFSPIQPGSLSSFCHHRFFLTSSNSNSGRLKGPKCLSCCK